MMKSRYRFYGLKYAQKYTTELPFVGEYETLTAAMNAAHELLRGFYTECVRVGETWEYRSYRRGVVGRICKSD